MLKHLSTIWEYRDFLSSHKNDFDDVQLKRLNSLPFKRAVHKLKKLDITLAADIIASSYSVTGRPARDPALLIRSFIAMQHFGYTSLHKWCEALESDRLLMYLLGSYEPLCVSNHYDFIERFTCKVHSMEELHNKEYYKKPDKKNKPKKGEKLINYSHSETLYLLDKYKNGAQADRDRILYRLQSLFNELAIIPSLDKGVIDTDDLVLSGDGSCLHISASKYPRKVKDGNDDEDIYRYSAPDADIGWDSDLETFYLGYTFYNISYHSKENGIDLPVYITLEKASRHDALNSLSAFAQLFDMNSDLHPKYVCLDSASDANAIYQYFAYNNIIAVIDRNKRRESKVKTNEAEEYIDSQGIPVCKSGNQMIYFGYDIQRNRKKYRCPLAMGKIKECPHKDQCSSSDYGRVIYINDGDEPRYGGPLRYRSDKWKMIYNNRTCTERVNNRVLNDYHLHQMRIRDLAKNGFFSIMAAINIHLDAWIKLDDQVH